MCFHCIFMYAYQFSAKFNHKQLFSKNEFITLKRKLNACALSNTILHKHLRLFDFDSYTADLQQQCVVTEKKNYRKTLKNDQFPNHTFIKETDTKVSDDSFRD